MPPKIARLAALGAYGACAAFIALFAYVCYLAAPSKTGGMMMALSVVSWISVGLVLVALLALHIVLAKQLQALADGRPRPV
jgi:TRAP-type C4-dicarboxylate transport system permease small subunit